MIENNDKCPCGSGIDFHNCCLPIIAGSKSAGSPGEVLRSRFTAYALGNEEYLYNSLHPEKREQANGNIPGVSNNSIKWHGLKIIQNAVMISNEQSTIEFAAYYNEGDKKFVHRELSVFKKHSSEWYFYKGKVNCQPLKIGRNDLCPCGSGKKVKVCWK